MVEWCLTENGHSCEKAAVLKAEGATQLMVEVGPRFNFTSAWSTNCVSVLKAAEVPGIPRVERSRRHLFTLSEPVAADTLEKLLPVIHDRMTEMVYEKPVETFDAGFAVKPVKWVPILAQGRKALEEINAELGLGFDDWDYEYYLDLYKNDLKRDPSDVELFDFAQDDLCPDDVMLLDTFSQACGCAFGFKACAFTLLPPGAGLSVGGPPVESRGATRCDEHSEEVRRGGD